MIKISSLLPEDLRFYFGKTNWSAIRWNSKHLSVSKIQNPPWDPYERHAKHFSRQKTITVESLLLAMGTAYSWMPTMLDINVSDYKTELRELVRHVEYLRGIKSSKALTQNKSDVIEKLDLVKDVINNSIVGTSKVLHLFSPKYIPIIDSRVVKGWNMFFQDIKDVKLIGCQQGVAPEKYFEYWYALLVWKENTDAKSVREIEHCFYKYGGSLSR